jgi:transposase
MKILKDSLKGFLMIFKLFIAAANRQGFISSWSNGPVEAAAAAGQVNRLKNIKRQMYGKAGFELLRKRVVITSQS